MTRRMPLPPHVSGSAFHVRDRQFHGASPGRLRAGDLQRPFTGVRSVGLDLDELADRCLAYEPLLRRGEAFSHETAAALYGLPLPHATEAVHVTTPVGMARARSKGCVGHVASDAVTIMFLRGLPLAAPSLVWCQLAAGLDPADLVALGDAIVTGQRTGTRRDPALASVSELTEAMRVWGSRRGVRALAWALPRVRVGAESRPETLTRLLLVDAGLPEPIPNDPTAMADGEVLHPDLKYPAWRIVFEYQGDVHRRDRRRWQADVRRRRAFEAAGWRVVDVTSDDLFVDPERFLAHVRDLVASVTGGPLRPST